MCGYEKNPAALLPGFACLRFLQRHNSCADAANDNYSGQYDGNTGDDDSSGALLLALVSGLLLHYDTSRIMIIP